jgi:hypothetical protein
MKRPSKYIDSDFTPPGFQWKDPAHLKAQECKNLLGHWYARQQKNLVPFQFRGDYGEGFIRRAKQKAKYVEPDPTRASAVFLVFVALVVDQMNSISKCGWLYRRRPAQGRCRR